MSDKQKKEKEPDEVIKARMDEFTNPTRKVDVTKINRLGESLGRINAGDVIDERLLGVLKEAAKALPLLATMTQEFNNLNNKTKKTIPSYHRSDEINTSLFNSDNVLEEIGYFLRGEEPPKKEIAQIEVKSTIAPVAPLTAMPRSAAEIVESNNKPNAFIQPKPIVQQDTLTQSMF